jgi:hypothetical protein
LLLPAIEAEHHEFPAMPAAFRKPTLVDGMIFVANFAIALTWHRWFMQEFRSTYRFLVLGPKVARGDFYAWCYMQCYPFLAMAAVTGLELRIRSPRPPWADLRRQPGSVACAIALLSIVFAQIEQSVSRLLLDLQTSTPLSYGLPFVQLVPHMFETGRFVTAAWVTMALTGCWRSEPSWVDRFARGVGIAWIFSYLFSKYVIYIT